MRTWLLAVSFGVFAAQATPPRDSPARAETGTAIVRGRITSAATGDPLHRVRITFNGPGPTPPVTVTNTRGEFEMTNLPAGSYSLAATRAGYLSLQYGQRRPQEAGRTLVVSDGQIIERIEMALARGGVLSGTVTDDIGESYPAVRVEALEFRYIRGRRVLVQAASTVTNDLGQFRLSGLPPGPYFLRASTTDTWQGDDGKDSYTYATTYYPGVTGADQAQSLTIAVEQELANLNFGLRAGRSATVTGVMQNANGEPLPSQAITLSRATRGVGGALFSTQGAGSARTDKNGSFEFPRLAPGEYIVGFGADTDRGAVTVTVADGDVRHVVLMPRKPTAVAGSIVTDEAAPPPFSSALLRVTPVPADPESLLPSFTAPGPTTVSREWAFRFANLDGQYLFRVIGLPPEWLLGAVLLNGRPLTDTALTIRSGAADIAGVQIVLTRKGGTVDGQVVNPDGSPGADSTVVVFAADAARWTLASRFVRAGRPDNAGRFSMAGLPAGTYYAAARDFVADGHWEDPDFLNSLTRQSVRFELGEGGSETLTLKLEPLR